ncbi:unnamed protein product [Darwinula stevensoni]|uniref:S-(hydroxymethyl)glutathione dehydrogenase n=1 Tax=Darwinula stevensoni TaxID=69355 RepID=A0A7R8XKK9_9CRUS|nr:unnamed protein product [Darwinula stevensoni]CAG0895350.1 unnamed protein product [Darwinula stevensoni]
MRAAAWTVLPAEGGGRRIWHPARFFFCRVPISAQSEEGRDRERVIECLAAVAWEANQPLRIETVTVAPPKAHEVRVKIHSTGVCHTDASTLWGRDPEGPGGLFPTILGHEGAGVVESVGDGVTNVKPGDHVIPLWLPQCGRCRACGKTNLCENVWKMMGKGCLLDGTSRFACGGRTLYHYMGTSTFSGYTVLPDVSVVKVGAVFCPGFALDIVSDALPISPSARLDRACLLGCGIPTGYGSALNTAKVVEGSSVAVWGLGTIGLAAVMGARKAKAKRIIGVDINPNKFQIGKKFGCTEFVNPNDHGDRPIQDVLADMTDGGLDFTFECIGNIHTMASLPRRRAALESLQKGWGVSTIVGVAGRGLEVSFPPFQLLLGRKWTGSFFGDYRGDDLPGLVEEYLKGELMVDEFVTQELQLDDINKAFDSLREGRGLRSVVTF